MLIFVFLFKIFNFIRIHIYIPRILIYINNYIHICIHVCKYSYLHSYVFICWWLYLHLCVLCIYMLTYFHMHMHMYIHDSIDIHFDISLWCRVKYSIEYLNDAILPFYKNTLPEGISKKKKCLMSHISQRWDS